MKTNLTLLFLLLPWLLQAQEENTEKKQSGYFNYTSIGSLIGSKNDDKTYITSLLMEHNYQFNKNWAVGLVTGVEWLDVTVMPLGPNIKGFLPGTNGSSFFAGLSSGYAFALEGMEFYEYEIKETKGGYFLNTELGYILPSKKDYSVFIAMGYRYHEFEFVRADWALEEVERKTTYNRFSIRIGVQLF